MKKRAAISYQRSVISGTVRRCLLITDYRLLSTARKGFSLVEVTLALAVAAIGLIAIIGLIPQGVTSSRDAADNTLAATIVQDTFSTLRLSFSTAATWPPTVPATPTYYDAAGTNVATAAQNQYFRVQLTSTATWVADVRIITATITWPDNSLMSTPALNTNIFVTEIARYQ